MTLVGTPPVDIARRKDFTIFNDDNSSNGDVNMDEYDRRKQMSPHHERSQSPAVFAEPERPTRCLINNVPQRTLSPDERSETGERPRKRGSGVSIACAAETAAEIDRRIKDLANAKDISTLALGNGITILLSSYAEGCRKYWTSMMTDEPAQMNGTPKTKPENGRIRVRRTVIDFYNAVAQWQSYQIDVWRMILASNIPFILDNDVERFLTDVMKEYEIEKIPSEVMMMAYRGSGKSCIIGAAVAALFRNTPNYSATLYAITTSKSIDLMNEVEGKMHVMEEARKTGMKWRRSKGNMMMKLKTGDIRTVVALSTFGTVRFPTIFSPRHLSRSRSNVALQRAR